MSASLASALASTGEQFSGDDHAEALVSAALAVAAKEPGRAAAIGMSALRAGRGIVSSGSFFKLLRVLLSSDREAGSRLFADALSQVQIENDEPLASTLASVAFPAAFSPGAAELPVPAEPLRVRTLELLARALTGTTGPAEEEAACRFAPLVAALQGEYARLLPEVSPRVRTQVGLCRPHLDAFSREGVSESQQPELTADEHLRRFKEGSETGPRMWHIMKALELVERARDFDQGIAMLDGLNDKELALLGEMWSGLRVKFAAAAAYDAFKAKNYAKMNQVLDTVPAKLRPMAQAFLARQVAAANAELCLDLLAAARRDLAKFPESDPPPSGLHFLILTQYEALNPAELPSVFREAAAAFDLYASRPPDRAAPADESLDAVNLPAALLHLYNSDAEQTASTIKNTRARVQVRLGLIHAALRRRGSLRAAKTPPQT
ncbi:MAG: hypothetical protein M3348_01440 [Acidobacteriota bacterium]|nr:hypothetical protein [Acidobacteriota bacterium]